MKINESKNIRNCKNGKTLRMLLESSDNLNSIQKIIFVNRQPGMSAKLTENLSNA